MQSTRFRRLFPYVYVCFQDWQTKRIERRVERRRQDNWMSGKFVETGFDVWDLGTLFRNEELIEYVQGICVIVKVFQNKYHAYVGYNLVSKGQFVPDPPSSILGLPIENVTIKIDTIDREDDNLWI